MPGNASGSMDGVALRPLTVAFHEPGFIATLNSEGAQADKLHWGGPANPQALNRYSYVMNNPMRWTDPTGHVGYSHEVSGENRLHLTHEEAIFLFKTLQEDATFYLGLSGNALENKTVAGFAQYLVSKLGALGPALTKIIGDAVVAAPTLGKALIVLGATATLLKGLDAVYGSNGIDITYGGAMPFAIVPPTVERQNQYWHNGRKICSKVSVGGGAIGCAY